MAIVALDQGTTSSRTVVFDTHGVPISQQNRAYAQLFPEPGWVEHDPGEILMSQLSTLRQALAEADLRPQDVSVLGITNQRETVIVWDRETGRPIYNAIVWQCRRTANIIQKLQADGLGPMIAQKTGLPLDAYFSASKLQWILDHVPDARQMARDGRLICGTVDTWLLWNLTGGKTHATDHTNASRTMLYNLHTHAWDPELLDLFNIPREMLPEILPSSAAYGVTDGDLVGSEIPIGGVAGDQQAALFGQCCFAPGEAKNTYGTGCFLLMNTGETPISSKQGLITTMAATREGEPFQYVVEGSIFVAGAAVQWLRDELKIIDSAAQTEALALSVPDSGGVVLVPAFTGLGAPYWDMYARGTLLGLTRGTGRAHIARATLESIALQTYDVLDAMQKETGIELSSLRVDGGASANNFLMQTQADLLNTSVIRPKVLETTALGAAYLAGLAAGIWKSTEDLRQFWELDDTFVPQISQAAREKQIHHWHRAVDRARGWAED